MYKPQRRRMPTVPLQRGEMLRTATKSVTSANVKKKFQCTPYSVMCSFNHTTHTTHDTINRMIRKLKRSGSETRRNEYFYEILTPQNNNIPDNSKF
jgi:hypothetical protein